MMRAEFAFADGPFGTLQAVREETLKHAPQRA
jgi:hypothetical protein